MDQNTTFIYKYSAKENQEVQQIRDKYLPRKESKFEELKRLDSTVQNSGILVSLCTGIIGALVFGFGFCLIMQVIGTGTFSITLGIAISVVGAAEMIAAYPIYRRIFNKTKAKLTPRIIELLSELTN